MSDSFLNGYTGAVTVAIIGLGTGVVLGANLEEAERNINQFVIDLAFRADLVEVERRVDHDLDGRFSFTLKYQNNECEVDIPGVGLDRVRYINDATQSSLDFPRLYVDGSSWYWKYALNIVRGKLLEGDQGY